MSFSLEEQIESLKKSCSKVNDLMKSLSKSIYNFKIVDQSFIDTKKGWNEDDKWIETMFDRAEELFLKRQVIVSNVLELMNVIKFIQGGLKQVYDSTQISQETERWYNYLIYRIEKMEITKYENIVAKIDKERQDEISKMRNKHRNEEINIENNPKELEEKKKQITYEEKEVEGEKETDIEDIEKQIESINIKYQNIIDSATKINKRNIQEIISKKRGNKMTRFANERIKPFKNILCEWSQKKDIQLIYDSLTEEIVLNKVSKLEQLVIGKKDLFFIIFDGNENIFGGYIDKTIDKLDYCIHSDTMFVFVLESNGRFSDPTRFKCNGNQKFVMFSCKNEWLFTFGYSVHWPEKSDIAVMKSGTKKQSYCGANGFEYCEAKNALCGNYNFVVEQMLVFEAISE
ncbi:hypothetical protein ENU1_212430 [Entamoeba nuttalli P19]|uniref:TLDc domain-containing protein n=1 Tax=Entamoeba nuttalli (strain P19) TaxID=1076696 RepID=K2GQ21_ENTNP|nr:hypothetical protein ENU1_212430 [Entamoeba nuttalli P19]EKE37018.1 hypothetical protein ENU1_212430 [Entamoeba nuttalli P19]|eukprot:XP_008860654.1 hypothetical protein ENU1_212430 [Entamoeba nuttalli P19]